MAIIFIDSFVYQGELGAAIVPKGDRLPTDKWDFVTPGVLAAYIRAPGDAAESLDFTRYALEIGDNRIGRVGKTILPTDHVVFGANWNWGASASFTVGFEFQFRDASGIVAKVEIKDTDINSFIGDSTQVKTALHGVSTTVGVARIEVRVKRHPTLGEIEVVFDGVVKSVITNLALGSSDITEIRIGTIFQTPTLMQMNDVYINDVTTGFTSPTDYFGAGIGWFITAKRPEFVDSANEFTDGVLAKDPQIGDSDSDFAHAGAVGKKLKLTYKQFADIIDPVPAAGVDDVINEDVIYAVQVSHHNRKTGTEVLQYKTQIDIGGTISQSATTDAPTVKSRWTGHIITEHPSTQNPLVQADVDGMIAGIEIIKRGV